MKIAVVVMLVIIIGMSLVSLYVYKTTISNVRKYIGTLGKVTGDPRIKDIKIVGCDVVMTCEYRFEENVLYDHITNPRIVKQLLVGNVDYYVFADEFE